MPTDVAPVGAANASETLDDPLLSFEAEADAITGLAASNGSAPVVAPAIVTSKHPVLIGLLSIVAIALIGTVLVAFQASRKPAVAPITGPALERGTVTFTSQPVGATVAIDSVVQGVTPLKMPVAAGQHTLEVAAGSAKRVQALSVDAGAVLAQHFEFAPVTAQAGGLDITSDPPGAQVAVDGAPRGVTPVRLSSVPVGEHRVTLSTEQSSIQRQVIVVAGATATVMAAMTNATGAAAGWAAIKSPIELQIFEAGKLITTSATPRFMLPAGHHDLEVANADVEFRVPLRVEIEPGKTFTASVAIPNGSLSINALPWAEVIIDGKPVGPTPIGNLSIPIGPHEIVWRHPQLGERKRVVAVAARTPVRVGLDFSK
jgi:PEGA domain-containing protein